MKLRRKTQGSKQGGGGRKKMGESRVAHQRKWKQERKMIKYVNRDKQR